MHAAFLLHPPHQVITKSLKIARLKAIIQVYEDHHANCPNISHENNALLQRDLRNLGVNFHDTQGTPPFADKENNSSLQVVLYGPENTKRKRKELSTTHFSSINKRNKSKPKNWEVAGKMLITNVADAEGVVIPPLYICAVELGTDTPFDRGRIYARKTSEAIQAYQEKEMQARLELFLFLSSCVVLEKLSILTYDEADQLMSALAQSESSAYFRKMRDGAAYLNRCLVSGLVAKAWELGDATSVVASSK